MATPNQTSPATFAPIARSAHWKLPALEARPTAASVDTDVVPVFQDANKKLTPPKGPYGKMVEKFRKGEVFTARTGGLQFIRFAGKGSADNVLFVGFGVLAELTEEKARAAGGSAWSRLTAERAVNVAVHVGGFAGPTGMRLIRAFAEGLVLGAYHYNKYKSKDASKAKSDQKAAAEYHGPSKLMFVGFEKSLKPELDEVLAQVAAVGLSVNVCRDWSNEPSNVGTPEFYAIEAQRMAREFGLKCTIIGEKEAAREKMGLFLGVGQGSEREGQIVVLEYTPKGAAKARDMKTIALVGKGVTFDSGGVSIKPSSRMEDMKHDMTGAATVMGAILLAAQWEVPNRVIAFMAFTENMPDGFAVQPGNVLVSRAGKTVEIINTDAEGRLVLADVLDYAHDFKPDAIIDVATLTGAVTVALGKHCCAILGNDASLIERVRRAGDMNGERIWELPLFDEYFDDLKSDYADMKNSANDGYGGTIRGAAFLKQFIRKGTAWAHLDIAATAYNLGHLPYFPKKGASGAHVRTLAQFAADF